MKNKTYFLAIALLLYLTAQGAAPKEKYVPGRVILLNKDTLKVFIKVKSLLEMQDGIEYKDSTGKMYAIAPANAKGFFFINEKDSMFFESRRDLKIGVVNPSNPKARFVYRVAKGKLVLYYYVTSKLVMVGFEQVAQDEPHYLVRLDTEWYHIAGSNLKHTFKKLFAMLREEEKGDKYNNILTLMNDIENDKYKFDDTPAIVERYNNIIVQK
jgi:hypothetical protein